MDHDGSQVLFYGNDDGDCTAEPPMPGRLRTQFELAAQFGLHAARGGDLPMLLDEVCRVAALGLETTFAKLLVYQPDQRIFMLQAGVGWGDGVVGQTRFDADLNTAAGFAWHSGHAIISNDLVAAGRFRTPPLLVEHGIVRSINVVVPGEDLAPFAVLEVESAEDGAFAISDVHFLQTLAHSLTAAITLAAQQALHATEAARGADSYQVSLREMQHRVRNDLQAIYITVAGEVRGTTDMSQREGFERINRRVLALGALYDHLLGAQASGNVDVGTYLRTLCDRIGTAADLPFRAIALTVEACPLSVGLGRAVRLAIAVNELVSNAIRHAFPDGQDGTISIALFADDVEDAGGRVLTVIDDGCGFGNVRPGRAGLGFVEKLLGQDGGTLAREAGSGTRWRITIPA